MNLNKTPTLDELLKMFKTTDDYEKFYINHYADPEMKKDVDSSNPIYVWAALGLHYSLGKDTREFAEKIYNEKYLPQLKLNQKQ